MSETSALWNGNFRKEAMDLISKLWRSLDDVGRTQLADAILSGPPADMLAHLDADERPVARDRRIFDRLVVIERVENPPLTAAMRQSLDEIQANYPQWRAAEGERAHFGTWMEMRVGPDTRYSVDDLSAMADAAVLEVMRTENEQREGLLDAWRQLMIADPRRGFNLLEQLARSDRPGPTDVWERGLWGLRDAKDAGHITDRMIKLLTEVPTELFEQPDFVRGAAQLLEARSRSFRDSGEPDGFWNLFDRSVLAAGLGEPAREQHDQLNSRDWVSEAINSPLGEIATAFVNSLFSRRLEVGTGLPSDLIHHATRLMSPDQERHRLARTVGASRISYLFAIDPDWTAKTLLPSFDWKNEDESIAMWQGYSWQARMDPQLWGALKGHFLQLFRPERLVRLGEWGRHISQTLMLVGVAFGPEELKRDEVRAAIRSMPEKMRDDAAEWIAGYMERSDAENVGDEEQSDASPDLRWNDRVWPWIKRVWPTEPSMRSSGVAEQFALAAIATDKVFPDAVDGIVSYAVATRGYQLLHELDASTHPDNHPKATLKLLDAFVAKEGEAPPDDELVRIVQRLGESSVVRDDNRFRIWAELVAQRRR